MAIEKGTYYRLVCDGCGEEFRNGYGGFDLYDSEEDARGCVGLYDGRATADGKVFCDPCCDSLAPAGEEK